MVFYGITGVTTPVMAMRVTGIGSQYLIAMADADKNYFDDLALMSAQDRNDTLRAK
jgi:hypothetical protein